MTDKTRFARYVVRAQQFGARVVLFQNAASDQLNLSAMELECFRLVQHTGPLTASDLAEETGLTPASLSVIVDKLVEKEYLSRKQDQNDRRRWILQANQSMLKKVEAVYKAHKGRVEKLLDAYSEEEFDIILRFMDTFANELKATAIELNQNDSD